MVDIFIDGACSGNPGLAAIGVVIKENGQIIKELSQGIGSATNNVAEYTALIYALKEALVLKKDEVKIYTDSELLYNQLKGQYKVQHANLKSLFDEVQHLAKKFKRVEMQVVPREQNQDADRLAKKAIKNEQAKVVASFVLHKGEESPGSEG